MIERILDATAWAMLAASLVLAWLVLVVGVLVAVGLEVVR